MAEFPTGDDFVEYKFHDRPLDVAQFEDLMMAMTTNVYHIFSRKKVWDGKRNV